jgi:branched-chain amino acid transport system ATP-binding protein
MMEPLLELRNVGASYGGRSVLHDISFAVGEGRVSTLLGANGAGKTTTLRAICGLVHTSGEVWFDGKRIHERQTEDIARQGLAQVPEGRGTLTGLSVEENLRVGAATRKDKASVASDLSHVYTLFPRLEERRKQQAGTLSGGEQQMLAIGRALMLRPRLLLLDEPSFGLAPRIVAEIFQLLATIKADGVSMLLVEQNATVALELADDAHVLETGRIVCSGTSAELRQNTEVQRAYLGIVAAR